MRTRSEVRARTPGVPLSFSSFSRYPHHSMYMKTGITGDARSPSQN